MRAEPGQIRVIDEEGAQLGILEVATALQLASERELDLVELDPHSVPPTCKIMNYGRYKYNLRKRMHKAKKTVKRRKEVKLRPKTEEHDLQVKIRQAKRFLSEGHKVLVTMVFRGREEKHPEFGLDLLKKFERELEEVAKLERPASREARNRIGMILAPKNERAS
ncbi:MAG: translation initiation factor IF-3 [Planctomycetes bacterium]|nr:translation initiation factor IF-3 [Planctomycetota bacterium]